MVERCYNVSPTSNKVCKGLEVPYNDQKKLLVPLQEIQWEAMTLFDRQKLGTPDIRTLLCCLLASSVLDVYYRPGHCCAVSMESGGASKAFMVHLYLHVSKIYQRAAGQGWRVRGTQETALVSGRVPEDEQMWLFGRQDSQGVRRDLREEKGSFQQEFTNNIFQKWWASQEEGWRCVLEMVKGGWCPSGWESFVEIGTMGVGWWVF